jgi:prepilin-type N-terminal cleavage/methylation domain-containing protein
MFATELSGNERKSMRRPRSIQRGMTLVEVVIALLISAIAVACMVSGYVFSINSAERSGLSLAATARAMERLEETRSARWDILSYPAVDELQSSNFPNTIVKLDISGSGSGITYGTNVTTIFQASADPPLKGIRVNCIWSFRGVQRITNTVETVRAPD